MYTKKTDKFHSQTSSISLIKSRVHICVKKSSGSIVDARGP